MNALSAVAQRVDDGLNPIVVKEARQAVRSRFVSAVFLVFLALQLVVVWLYVLFNPDLASELSGGRDVTGILFSILTGSCMLFVPVYSGVRLAWERSAVQMDLMFTTTVSPGAVIRGKMVNAALLTGLIYSACAPFMTFAYLLRGIDLPTIFLMLALGLLNVALAVQFALFLACIPTSILAKVFLGLFGMGVLLFWMFSGLWMGFAMSSFGPFGPTGGSDFWTGMATLALSALLTIGLLYVFSVAVLSPPSANRMLPVRAYIVAVWLVLGIVSVLWKYLGASGAGMEPWAACSVAFFAIWFAVAVSERSAWGARVRRRIPKRILARAVAFLFTSGLAAGVLWTAGMIVLTLAIFYLVDGPVAGRRPGGDFKDFFVVSAGLALYGFAYAMTAAILRRLLFSGRRRIPHYYTWVIAMALLTVGTIFPGAVLILTCYGTGRWSLDTLSGGPWTLTNPFYLFSNDSRVEHLVFGSVWAALMAAASIPWMVREAAAFRPLASEPGPSSGSVTHG